MGKHYSFSKLLVLTQENFGDLLLCTKGYDILSQTSEGMKIVLGNVEIQKAIRAFFTQEASLYKEMADGDTFSVEDKDKHYFLKLCREAEGADYLPPECLYHTGEQLEWEGRILEELHDRGLAVAAPLKDREERYASPLSPGLWATASSYLPGTPMDQCREDPVAMAFAAGAAAGLLHNASQEGVRELARHRPHRGKEYLCRMLDRLALGHESYHSLSRKEHQTLCQGGEVISACMDLLERDPVRNLGLVHTDIRAANLLYDTPRAMPVDFTRCVYGFHLYDLGEMTAHMGGMVPGGSREHILAGYASVRELTPLDAFCVDAFLVEFLLLVTAENVYKAGDPWFRDTIEKLCKKLIPQLLEDRLPELLRL